MQAIASGKPGVRYLNRVLITIADSVAFTCRVSTHHQGPAEAYLAASRAAHELEIRREGTLPAIA